MIAFKILGVFAGLFALALLVLPTIRVRQGKLDVRRSIGLWISGVGFAWLAVAALFVDGDVAVRAASLGIVAAVVGSLVQHAATKDRT